MSNQSRVKSTTLSFNALNISAVSSSVTNPKLGFSTSEKRAAARAILRHNIHTDASKLTIPNGRLDHGYCDLHGRGDARGVELEEIKGVTNEALRDVLDAIFTLDVIDGGISLLLHCSGYRPTTAILPENITIETYVSPRELAEGGDKLSEIVALIVQDFGTSLAIPHLHRFQTRCNTEGVKPPTAPTSGKQILVEAPYLPRESTRGSGHTRCRCRPGGRTALAQAIAAHKLPTFDSNSPPGALKELRAEATGNNSGQDQYANVESGVSGTSGDAIISIGPKTDWIIERFHLDDSIIPRFRGLIQTVRSSRWEEVLRGDKWGFTFEQAVKISDALQSDLEILEARAARPPAASSSKLLIFITNVLLVVLAFVWLSA